MNDIKELAKQIATDFELSIKERTDKLLELDCNMYTNLGTDSTKTQKQEVKKIVNTYTKQLKVLMKHQEIYF